MDIMRQLLALHYFGETLGGIFHPPGMRERSQQHEPGPEAGNKPSQIAADAGPLPLTCKHPGRVQAVNVKWPWETATECLGSVHQHGVWSSRYECSDTHIVDCHYMTGDIFQPWRRVLMKFTLSGNVSPDLPSVRTIRYLR